MKILWKHVVPSLSQESHGISDGISDVFEWLSLGFITKNLAEGTADLHNCVFRGSYCEVQELKPSSVPLSPEMMLGWSGSRWIKKEFSMWVTCKLWKSSCILSYFVLDKSTLLGHPPWKSSSWLVTHTYMIAISLHSGTERERERAVYIYIYILLHKLCIHICIYR